MKEGVLQRKYLYNVSSKPTRIANPRGPGKTQEKEGDLRVLVCFLATNVTNSTEVQGEEVGTTRFLLTHNAHK